MWLDTAMSSAVPCHLEVVPICVCVSVCNWVGGVGSRPLPPLLYASGSIFLGKRFAAAFAELGSDVFDLFIFQMNTAWNVVFDLLKSLLKRCRLGQPASDFFFLICLILMTSSRGERRMRMVNVKPGVHTALMSCSFFFFLTPTLTFCLVTLFLNYSAKSEPTKMAWSWEGDKKKKKKIGTLRWDSMGGKLWHITSTQPLWLD